jgi:hypothetical protein
MVNIEVKTKVRIIHLNLVRFFKYIYYYKLKLFCSNRQTATSN